MYQVTLQFSKNYDVDKNRMLNKIYRADLTGNEEQLRDQLKNQGLDFDFLEQNDIDLDDLEILDIDGSQFDFAISEPAFKVNKFINKLIEKGVEDVTNIDYFEMTKLISDCGFSDELDNDEYFYRFEDYENLEDLRDELGLDEEGFNDLLKLYEETDIFVADDEIREVYDSEYDNVTKKLIEEYLEEIYLKMIFN